MRHRPVSAQGRIVPGRRFAASSRPAIGIDGAVVALAADSIVKEDGAAHYGSLIHLKGNVEIRTCCVQRSSQSDASRTYLIVSADEADYDGESGNIDARGTVHVSFHNVK